MITTKRGRNAHTVCLAAMFLLGSAVISVPFEGADELNLLGFITAAAVWTGVSALLMPLIEKLFNKSQIEWGKLRRAVFSVLWLLVCIGIVADAAVSFGQFVDFVGEVVLPVGSRWFIALVLFGTAAFFCTRRGTALPKFALPAFVLTAGLVLLFFAMSFSELRLENISLMRLPRLMGIVNQAVPYLLRVFLPTLTLYIYVALDSHSRRAAIGGTVAGGAVLGLCLANALLLFGARLSAELDYPYASAIGTVTIGELFTRMDGFSYFIYFAACIVKLSVCVAVVSQLIIYIIGERRHRAVSVFVLALIACVGGILYI